MLLVTPRLIREQIVFIGAGSVATHFARKLKTFGFKIRQVFSRSLESAQALADHLNCQYTTDIKEVVRDADIYFFSLPDHVLPEILQEIPPNNGLWVHTSGSLSVDVFSNYSQRYGVIYPLQTFSKQHIIDLLDVPMLVEANHVQYTIKLLEIASWMSRRVELMSSEKRKYVHLAAVFACNFSNHLYHIATQILKSQDVDWEILQPLICETALKLCDMPPDKAQTGPAVRGDTATIEQHLSLLADENMRKLYAMMTENIQNQHKKE